MRMRGYRIYTTESYILVHSRMYTTSFKKAPMSHCLHKKPWLRPLARVAMVW